MKKPENTKNQEAQKRTYEEIRSLEVKRVKMFGNGGVTADVNINGVDIYGVRVVEGKNGDFLSFPQRKGSDGKYYHIAYVYMNPNDQQTLLEMIERRLNGN